MPDWKNLVYKLSELLQGPLASIEILPGGLEEWQNTALPEDAPKIGPDFPFVLMEGNLGIPKKILYALYMSAVAMPWRSSGPQTANSVSSVIILVNPAHQTALNTRKRLITDGDLDPRKELLLIEVMSRGSPECAKESIIWTHRRWCFDKVYGPVGPKMLAPSPPQGWARSEEMQLFPRLSPGSIQHELRLIQYTCETYPRNYHSWAHWHSIINVCYASIYLSDDTASRRIFLGIIVEECERLRQWLELHVSDYSAMYQLCQAQNLVEFLAPDMVDANDLMQSLISSALPNHALSLVTSFPTHESLWMYLRISLGSQPGDDRTTILKRIPSQSQTSLTSTFSRHLIAWFSNRWDLETIQALRMKQESQNAAED